MTTRTAIYLTTGNRSRSYDLKQTNFLLAPRLGNLEAATDGDLAPVAGATLANADGTPADNSATLSSAVYPNPSNGLVTISLAEKGVKTEVSVIDANGVVRHTFSTKADVSVNLASYGIQKGTYTLVISRDQTVERKTIVIQ
ncbi:MAG: T9SS type A sorting domain-containing protein [Bacteroidota bacterium]